MVEQVNSHLFEIVVQIRDNLGNATGRTKFYSSDNSYDIWQFWNKNNGVRKKRRRKTKKEKK